MNGFTIISTTYAFLAAFPVVGKIQLQHRLKSDNSAVDKEATDDFMDLMAVLVIAVAFYLEMVNQFTDSVNWALNQWAVVLSVFVLTGGGLVYYGVTTETITTEYHNDSWTRAHPRSGWPLVLPFAGVVVLIADAIATRNYELLTFTTWIPLVLLYIVLIVSIFAQRLFGRPPFTPKPHSSPHDEPLSLVARDDRNQGGLDYGGKRWLFCAYHTSQVCFRFSTLV